MQRFPKRFALAALCAVSLLTPAAAQAVVPTDAVWTQDTVTSLDGTRLHADIFRDKNVAADARLPVILTVSPYTIPESGGPSTRFNDFVNTSKVLKKGYRYVMVTMRSFGLSEGCSDWGGPGEQADVVAAVQWAARQPWSTGKVGLFGKSYDAWTGLMGIANRAPGLSAVVSMEPVYDGYRYLYSNGVRFVNSALTPTSFMTTAQPACAAQYVLDQQDDDADSAFWQARELISKSRGATTPLFLTQGFLEANTKQDGAFDYYKGIAGYKHAWLGQWDHVRGYERDGAGYQTGKSDFIDEVLAFYGSYLKDDDSARAALAALPPVEVQDSDGRFRGEAAWPPADAAARQTTLKPGAYTDSGLNFGSGDGLVSGTPNTGLGQWSISQALAKPVRMAGEPVIDADVVTVAPRANFVANVYDIAPDGKAILVSRGARLVRLPGPQTISLQMYGQDWVYATGHRIGVLLSGSNNEWWVHEPTQAPVVITHAFATLPLIAGERTAFLPGVPTSRLLAFRTSAAISVPAQVVTLNEVPFNVGG
jgi:predicted acyl esterase